MKIIFVFFVLLFASSAFAALPYPVRVNGVGTNVPASGGVSLPAGVSCSQISLWDGVTEVPMRASALQGQGNWCLLDFTAADTKGPNGSTDNYFVLKQQAPVASVTNPVQVSYTGGNGTVTNCTTITVTVGTVVWTISCGTFNLFETVTVGGSTVVSASAGNITLVNCTKASCGKDGLTYTATNLNSGLSWEYQNDARATLKVDGIYKNGSTEFLTYTTRITWYANHSYAKVEHSIRNSLSSAKRHAKIQSAKLVVGGATTTNATCSITNGVNKSCVNVGYVAVSAGSGKTFDLVPTTQFDGTVNTAGNGGLMIPDQTYLTQKVVFDFNSGTDATRANTPALAYTDYERYGSNLVGPQMGSTRDESATYAQYGWTVCTTSWLCGVADTPTAGADYWRGVRDLDVHQDAEDDDLWQNFAMFLRSAGKRGYLNRAAAWARYFTNEYTPRSDGYSYCTTVGGYFGDSRNTCTRDANAVPITLTGDDDNLVNALYLGTVDGYDVASQAADHLFGWGLLDWYRVTGDIVALDAAKDLGEIANYASTWQGDGYSDGFFTYGMRERARHLLLMTELYRVTGDSTWLTAINIMRGAINTSPDWNSKGFYQYGEADTNSVCGGGFYASGGRAVSSFQLGLLSRAMMDYYENVDQDATFRTRMIAMGTFVRDWVFQNAAPYPGLKVCISSSNVVSHYLPSENGAQPLADILVRAYELTGTASYLDQAKTSWQLGSVGRYANGRILTDGSFITNGDLQYVGRLFYVAPRVSGQVTGYWQQLSPSGNGSGTGSAGNLPMGHRWTQGFWDPKRSALVFVFGGIGGGCTYGAPPTAYLNDAWRFSFGKNYWTQLLQVFTADNTAGAMGSDNVGNAYDAVNDTYWPMQGTCSDGYNVTPPTEPTISQFWNLNPDTLAWTQFPRTGSFSNTFTRYSRMDPGYAASPTKLLLFGGAVTGAMSDTWEIDFATQTMAQQSPVHIPPARYQAENSMVYDSTNGKFILFGGRSCETAGCGMNDLWTYDLTTHDWTELKTNTPPVGRSMNLLVFNSKYGLAVSLGGEGANIPLDEKLHDVYAVNAATSTWTIVSGAEEGAGTPYIGNMAIGAYDSVDDLILMFNQVPETWALVLIASGAASPPVINPPVSLSGKVSISGNAAR